MKSRFDDRMSDHEKQKELGLLEAVIDEIGREAQQAYLAELMFAATATRQPPPFAMDTPDTTHDTTTDEKIAAARRVLERFCRGQVPRSPTREKTYDVLLTIGAHHLDDGAPSRTEFPPIIQRIDLTSDPELRVERRSSGWNDAVLKACSPPCLDFDATL